MSRKIYLAILGAFFIQGCGDDSSDLFVATGGGSAPILSLVQGSVTGPDGSPLVNAQVSVEERTTHFDGLAFTDSNGTYTLSLPPGVYDVAVDGAGNEANGFFGPIQVQEDIESNFSLLAGDPRPGLVAGQISVTPGQPAAGRKLRLVAVTATSHDPLVPADVPDDIETTTDAEGRFEVDFGTGQELAFDVEIFEADGSLDEHVNVIKPPGGLQVSLSADQSPVENVLRAGEWDGETLETFRLDPPPLARFQYSADIGFFVNDYRLTNGLVPHDDKFRPWSDYIGRQGGRDADAFNRLLFEETPVFGQTAGIECNGDGDFAYDHQLVIKSGPIINAASVVYRFYDRTGSSYSLRRFATSPARANVVNYNSAFPDINTIEIRI
jgi:hypothetical protein